MYGNIGKEAKKQKECCTFLLQCCGPLRVGKRGLQTLPRFCCWWLTIDYFFLPHFIIWFNILGQGVLWQDRGWVRQWRGGGLNLFLQSNFLRIYGQWYVFVSFTFGQMESQGRVCQPQIFLKRSIQEFICTYMNTSIIANPSPKYAQSLHSLFIEQSLKCFEMKLSTVLPLPKGERACVPLSKCEAVSLGTR